MTYHELVKKAAKDTTDEVTEMIRQYNQHQQMLKDRSHERDGHHCLLN